jgi:hypothetical protein
MRVKMKVQITGTRNNVSWPGPGEEVTLPDSEGADLCAAGLASPVAESEPDVETRRTPGRKPKAE